MIDEVATRTTGPLDYLPTADAAASESDSIDGRPPATPVEGSLDPVPPELPQQPAWLRSDSTNAPAPGSGFRYERKLDGPSRQDDFIAGLDESDQRLVRNATLYGGRALTFITLASLAFYIYVGLSGGISASADRV